MRGHIQTEPQNCQKKIQKIQDGRHEINMASYIVIMTS